MSTDKRAREITDLALASYLSTNGHKLLSVEPICRKFTFLFESSDALETDVLSFFNREARVDALTFSETLRNLKALTLQH